MGWHVFILDFLSRNAHAKLMPSWQSPWPKSGLTALRVYTLTSTQNKPDPSVMCQVLPHTHKVQAPGSTWDLPSELYTHCSFCPCAQEITGHNRSDQNAMMRTETPGKFLFSRISLVAGFGGSWYGWAVHACTYWSAISTLVEITRAGDSQTVSNSCYRPQSLQFRLVSFPFLCYLTGGYREAIARLFLELYSSETRCNGHKLESGKLQLDVRKLDI